MRHSFEKFFASSLPKLWLSLKKLNTSSYVTLLSLCTIFTVFLFLLLSSSLQSSDRTRTNWHNVMTLNWILKWYSCLLPQRQMHLTVQSNKNTASIVSAAPMSLKGKMMVIDWIICPGKLNLQPSLPLQDSMFEILCRDLCHIEECKAAITAFICFSGRWLIFAVWDNSSKASFKQFKMHRIKKPSALIRTFVTPSKLTQLCDYDNNGRDNASCE